MQVKQTTNNEKKVGDKKEGRTINFGIFVKLNFVNSYNKFRNVKDKLSKEIQKEALEDIEGE